MPIIIHEFEVSVEPQQKSEAREANVSTQTDPASGLHPEDIAQIERYYCERRRRLRAD